MIAALAAISLLLASCGTSSTRRAASTPSTSVPPARNSATVSYSRGFDFYNLSSTPVTFVRADEYSGGSPWVHRDWDSGAPPDGSVLPPGGHQNFQVTWHFLVHTMVQVQYESPNGINSIDLTAPADADASFGSNKMCPTDSCNFDGTTATFLDAPGTVHNIPALQGQDQSQVLNQLCAQSNQAKCTFTPTKEEFITGPETTIQPVIPNRTQDDALYTLECSNSIGWSDSIGGEISAEFGIADIVEAAVKVKYSHDINADNVFTATLEMTIRPGYEGWVTHAASMFREWGDFTITMGNSTWHLTTIYFDVPNSTSNSGGHPDLWTPTTQKMGAPGQQVSRAAGIVRATDVQDANDDNGVDYCKKTHG